MMFCSDEKELNVRIISNQMGGDTLMRQIRSGVVVLIAALLLLAASVQVQAQGMFYMEVPKDGRIYVFNNQKSYMEFQQTGDIEAKILRIGTGPNGETMVFDSEDAIHLYNFKHNLPDEVIAKPEPAAAPAMQEKLPYRFSGLMFGDYFYNTSRDPNIATMPNVATGGAKDLNGFQFRRIYFTFDDDLSPSFTTRFRLEADQAALSSNGKISVFVKDAYLQWKNAFGQSDLWFGEQPTAAYDASESAWGFRSLEKTIMDLRGIVPSRDLSVALKGKFDANGKYNYWVSVGNNSGNSPEIDKFKRFYFQFRYKPSDNFQFAIYDDIKQNPKLVDPNNANNKLADNTNTFAAFVNVAKKDKYSLGFETFVSSTANGNKVGALPPFQLSSKKAIGYSAWGWYQFNTIAGVVGRYDYFEPNNGSATVFEGDKRNLYLFALFLKPHKNVWIMPNVEIESYEDSPTGASYETSVTPRLTFYCTFP